MLVWRVRLKVDGLESMWTVIRAKIRSLGWSDSSLSYLRIVNFWISGLSTFVLRPSTLDSTQSDHDSFWVYPRLETQKSNDLFQKRQYDLQQWFEQMPVYSCLENASIPAMICKTAKLDINFSTPFSHFTVNDILYGVFCTFCCPKCSDACS